MMAEDQEQRFSCRFCDKNFSSGKSLGGHMRCHLALIYAKNSEEEDDWDVGFKKFHKEKKVPLSSDTDPKDVGGASYELRENPKISWRISDGDFKKISVCKECGKGFSSLISLAGHMRVHSVKGKKEDIAICKECGKEFDSVRALFGHMRCHSKRSRVSSESDYEMACPVKKKRSTTRYNTTTTSHASNSNSDSFIHFTEVEEVAMCLIMLSRGVRCWDEFSLSVDATKFFSSGNLESWSCLGKGFARKQDNNLRSECGNETRKMRVNIESSVSEFGNFGSCLSIDDEKRSELDVSYDQSLSCDKSKNTPDMKKGIISPTELELYGLVTKVKLEQVDMGSQKANSIRKANFADDQFELDGNSCVDQLQYSSSASELLKDNERKGKFKCKTCDKTFKTPQALGSHRNTHRKNESIITVKEENCRYVAADSELHKLKHSEYSPERDESRRCKEHECAICFKVFASGQALGGHKRAHYVGLVESKGKEMTLMEKALPNHNGDSLDLNIPANVEEESVWCGFRAMGGC